MMWFPYFVRTDREEMRKGLAIAKHPRYLFVGWGPFSLLFGYGADR